MFPTNAASLMNLNDVVGNAIETLLAFVGVAFFLMLVYGGYLFLSAGSSKEAAVRAKNTLLYAFIGIVLSFSAWIFLQMAGSFLGYNFGTFDICIITGC